MILTGAQILIEELVKNGADTIFGYPGGAVLDIYDELYKNSDRIEHILSAHEQGAAHAADGYARVTGKPGVVIATSGPGATNLVTGIANAYLDSVPMVAFTGNVAEQMLGKDSFQEVDIIGITQPIVKHSYIARNVEDLAGMITEAFALANSGRKGPVVIDIPKSTQRATCEYNPDLHFRVQRKLPVPDFTEAVKAIQESKRPYIYAGGGVLAAGATEEVEELSRKISAPIGLSLMGLTAIPDSYMLNLGMTGMHGRVSSITAQSEADLVIAVGVRFSDRATGNVEEYRKNCKVIHVDIDEAEMGKNVPGIIELLGDAKKTLQGLIKALDPIRNDEWMDRCLENKYLDFSLDNDEQFIAKNIIGCINRHVKPETVVATDVGQHQMWVMQHYKFEKPRTLLSSGGLGTMGYGFGAAIGGCVASDRKPTVLFTGDGSFGMNLNEMATAVSQKLPIVIVLFNNGTLGMVRQWQRTFYENRYSSTTLARKTDFPLLAKAFGADGCTVYNLEELEACLAAGLPEDGPFLIECMIDIDDKVLPMIPPGGSFGDIMLD
ncbi:MAG: biosynthetic-type acetolactate synthase large subunit [Tissierellia bacterium]|nr:biosynthetic-type acetolactate synthase large subunit [Tissierellia bacterium]